MDGLAQQMAQPQGMQAETAPQGGQMPTLEEVIALLLQGATPQQLLEMGVPEEMIMQAAQVLEQELAAQQAMPPATEAGLAQTMAG